MSDLIERLRGKLPVRTTMAAEREEAAQAIASLQAQLDSIFSWPGFTADEQEIARIAAAAALSPKQEDAA